MNYAQSELEINNRMCDGLMAQGRKGAGAQGRNGTMAQWRKLRNVVTKSRQPEE